jgi:hypothetical protein
MDLISEVGREAVLGQNLWNSSSCLGLELLSKNCE